MGTTKAPPCCSIVPPHILRHILKGGDPTAAAAALHTIQQTARLMGMREVNQRSLPPAEDMMGQEYRQVFDCGGSEWLPGRLVYREGMGGTPKDKAVAEAYNWADATYQTYKTAFGRNSIDGRGMRLINTVHFSRQYDNAFWNGRQMIYGDGDGVIFNRFTAAVDVVGHELTHGVTQYTAALEYQDQPGALNESVSDCFGSMVKQFLNKQPADQADWLIGAGLLAKGVNGRALRDMANPGTAYDDPRLGKDPQPADMSAYVNTSDDNGGVHLNSGIPNRAFYLAAVGCGGHSWEGAGRAWYDALVTLRNPQAQFADWANQTVASAQKLFGASSKQAQAVQGAWQQVKVL